VEERAVTEDGTSDGINRRQALKRLAAAGAVAWATPAVQTLNMSRAHAQTSPPPPEACFSIAFRGTTCYEYNGNNFQCDVDPVFVQAGGCAQGVTIDTNGPVYGSYGSATWIVTIPAGCSFVTGWTHGGPQSLCEQNAVAVVNGDGTTTVTFYPNSDVPGDGHYGISNVQLTFCCGDSAATVETSPSPSASPTRPPRPGQPNHPGPNQQGNVAGASGPTGSTGPSGPSGPSGPTGATGEEPNRPPSGGRGGSGGG